MARQRPRVKSWSPAPCPMPTAPLHLGHMLEHGADRYLGAFPEVPRPRLPCTCAPTMRTAPPSCSPRSSWALPRKSRSPGSRRNTSGMQRASSSASTTTTQHFRDLAVERKQWNISADVSAVSIAIKLRQHAGYQRRLFREQDKQLDSSEFRC